MTIEWAAVVHWTFLGGMTAFVSVALLRQFDEWRSGRHDD